MAEPPAQLAVAAFEALPLAAFVLGPDGALVATNRVAREAVANVGGMHAVAANLAGAKAVIAARDEDRAVVGQATLVVDAGRLEREIVAAPLGRSGQVVVCVHLGSDASPADRAAYEHLQRLETLLAHTTDIITVLDAGGRVQFSNAAAGRMVGLTGEEASGMQAFELVHPDDIGVAADALAAALAAPGVGPSVELRLRFADGQWRTVAARINNLLGVPGVDGLVVTLHDVSERREAEAQLERREARHRSLIENLVDVIVVLDDEFQVSYVSPAISRLIPAPPETNLGQSAFNDIHPDDLPAIRSMLVELRGAPLGASRQTVFRLESLPGTGDWRWIEATCVNRVQDPAVEGIVCTLHDITDQRRAADDLHAALERERAATARLREIDRLKDDFLTTVSHELRTPLTSILGFADLLARGELDDDMSADLVRRVGASASDMRSMVDNILDFLSLQAGRVLLRRQALDVREMVDGELGHLGHLAAGRTVEVAGATGVAVIGDPDGVRHVLRNLLANALRYSPPDAPVRVRIRQKGDTVEVDVEDEGPGIPEDQLPHLFERFWRAPGASHSGRRGLGIGLNIAERYAELLGGSLSVRSEPGAGSCFTVRLPAG